MRNAEIEEGSFLILSPEKISVLLSRLNYGAYFSDILKINNDKVF
jgi:hypothetical protein